MQRPKPGGLSTFHIRICLAHWPWPLSVDRLVQGTNWVFSIVRSQEFYRNLIGTSKPIDTFSTSESMLVSQYQYHNT